MQTVVVPPRETISPKDRTHWLELRAKDITSTEVSALFGLSPYLTEFELWHRKKSQTYVEINPSERMKWGTRLENSIATGIAEDQGWKIRRKDEYVRDPILRIGSSFDFEVLDNDAPKGLLEIKNVDSLMFRDGWVVDGDSIEAPPHIELQVQHQLLVSKLPEAHIGALIGGNKVVLIRREADPKIALAIMNKITLFWQSVEDGVEPKPNFERDAKFISQLYNFAEPNKLFDARGSSEMLLKVEQYRKAGEEIKRLETEREGIKAQILMEIGEAEKVTGDGFTISAGVIGEADIAYHRNAYRSFKVSWKKAKA